MVCLHSDAVPQLDKLTLLVTSTEDREYHVDARIACPVLWCMWISWRAAPFNALRSGRKTCQLVSLRWGIKQWFLFRGVSPSVQGTEFTRIARMAYGAYSLKAWVHPTDPCFFYVQTIFDLVNNQPELL